MQPENDNNMKYFVLESGRAEKFFIIKTFPPLIGDWLLVFKKNFDLDDKSTVQGVADSFYASKWKLMRNYATLS